MDDVRIGLIGAGRIGTSHARLVAERVPGARLVAVADPRPGQAAALADRHGAEALEDPAALLAADLDAVIITASSQAHSELIVAAARAGRAIFCEKPASMTLSEADTSLAAVEGRASSSRWASTAASRRTSARPTTRCAPGRSAPCSSCAP